MTRTIELTPVDNRKSFYGKAYAEINGDTITLRSYGTAILRLTGDKLTRCWHGWSQTTQKNNFQTHETAFLFFSRIKLICRLTDCIVGLIPIK